MKTIVFKRSMNFSEYISEGFKIFFSRIKDFSLLTLIMIIPAGLYIIVIAYEYPSDNTKIPIIKLLLLCSVLIIQFVTSLIALVGIKLITESIVEDRPMSLSVAIKLALSKWSRAITTQFVTNLIIFGLSLLLFIPGLIYSIFYMFTLDAVALREKTGKAARIYSEELVEGQWGRIFWISTGIGSIYLIFYYLMNFLLGQISENPYFGIVPLSTTLYLAGIVVVINTVLFLNIDHTKRHRVVVIRETEITRKGKKNPTFAEALKKKREQNSPVRRSTVKKVSPKPDKSRSPAKKNTRRKEVHE